MFQKVSSTDELSSEELSSDELFSWEEFSAEEEPDERGKNLDISKLSQAVNEPESVTITAHRQQNFLKERIKTELVDKYSDLLLDDITQNYNLCYNEAVRILTEIRNNANEQIKLANSSVDELRKKWDESQKKLDEYSSQKKEVDKKIQEVLSAIHAVSTNFKI